MMRIKLSAFAILLLSVIIPKNTFACVSFSNVSANNAVCSGSTYSLTTQETGSPTVGWFEWQYKAVGSSSFIALGLNNTSGTLPTGEAYSLTSSAGPITFSRNYTITITNIKYSTSGYSFRLAWINGGGTCPSEFATAYTLTVNPNTWTGTASNLWNNTSNWSCGYVPTATSEALLSNFPVNNNLIINNNNYTVQDLTVFSGASITIFGASSVLRVTGDINLNDEVYGEGKIILNGTTQQTLKGNGTYNNLELDNPAGAVIANNQTVGIRNVYEPTNGTLVVNGTFILRSDATNTARIGQGTGTYISGNVTVQRYIPGKRAFRFLGHPFTTQISLSHLTNGSGFNITGNPTGSASSSTACNGCTATATNAPSVFQYDNAVANSSTSPDPGWAALSTDLSLLNWDRYKGIRAFVRGSNGQGLNGNAYTPNPTTPDMFGPINMGTQTVTIPYGGNSNRTFSLISNPFPSPINVAITTRGSSIGSSFYTWDATIGTRGGYETTAFSAAGSYILPMSAAFFVTASASTNNTIQFPEACKTTASPTTLFSTETLKEQLQFKLYSDSIYWDRLTIYFNKQDKNTLDYNDAIKLSNPDVNLYSTSADNNLLAIDSRPYPIGTNNTIPMVVRSNEKRSFQLTVALINTNKDTELWLHDKQLNKLIKLETATTYNFETAADIKDSRFEVLALPLSKNLQDDPALVAENSFKVIPSLINDNSRLLVSYNSDKQEKTVIRIINTNGSIIATYNMGEQKNIQTYINTNNLSKGLLMVQMQRGEKKFIQKIIKL